MSNKLARRIKRELKANPKKAAFLGLLGLVASYFWAPILAGWFGGPPAPVPAAPGQVNDNAATVSPAARGTLPAPGTVQENQIAQPTPNLTWREASRLLETALGSLPQMEGANPRDPFRSVLAEAQQKEQAEAKKMPKVVKKLTPQTAGMQLSSTVVGPRRRLALVDGGVYAVGDRIKVAKDGNQALFRLREVQPRQIVLEGGGNRYTLSLPEPTLSGKDAMERTTGSQQGTASH